MRQNTYMTHQLCLFIKLYKANGDTETPSERSVYVMATLKHTHMVWTTEQNLHRCI